MLGLEEGCNQLLLRFGPFISPRPDMHDPVFGSISGKWVVFDSVSVQCVEVIKLEQVGQTSLGND